MSHKLLREQIEKKYNINLNIEQEEGEKTYWDLRNYFTKEIEEENILISTDNVHLCCHRTDINCMKEDFKKQMKQFEENDPGPCDDPSGIGCSNIENNENNESQPPPPYN